MVGDGHGPQAAGRRVPDRLGGGQGAVGAGGVDVQIDHGGFLGSGALLGGGENLSSYGKGGAIVKGEE
ncbi:MAG: hypothetical protein Kow0092_36170 [Deferrisomatales bacterium]